MNKWNNSGPEKFGLDKRGQLYLLVQLQNNISKSRFVEDDPAPFEYFIYNIVLFGLARSHK